MRPYELEGVFFPVGLEEIVDISILHPFRYHHKLVFLHRDTQKGEHVRMAKSVPCHNLFAERLQGGSVSAGQGAIYTMRTHA